MFAFTPLSKERKSIGEERILKHGESDTVVLWGDNPRHRRVVIVDASGVVSASLDESEFDVMAVPSPVRPFGGERGKLSHLLNEGQQVTYMLNISPKQLLQVGEKDVVGVLVRRLLQTTA